MATDRPATRAPEITDDLLVELQSHATVLAAKDQAEEIALDLHEDPFSPTTRSRVLGWFKSDTYRAATQRARALRGAPEVE